MAADLEAARRFVEYGFNDLKVIFLADNDSMERRADSCRPRVHSGMTRRIISLAAVVIAGILFLRGSPAASAFCARYPIAHVVADFSDLCLTGSQGAGRSY